MLIQGQVTQNIPTVRATGQPNSMQVQLGELGASQIMPRYAAATWSSQCFSASVSTAANNSTFTGGAGGTPFIAIWNPAGTGKNLWPIIANIGNVATATTTAGVNNWALWYGTTAAVTAAASSTFPVNNLTQQATGSVAKAFINTATTTSSALTNAVPMGAFNWQTSAQAEQVSNSVLTEFFGAICIPPGAMMALGGSLALTATTWIGYLSWVEIPI